MAVFIFIEMWTVNGSNHLDFAFLITIMQHLFIFTFVNAK